MSHFLVTGGCGFIGSHLTDRLIELGHKVTVFDNLSSGSLENLNIKAEFVEGDIRDKALLQKTLKDIDGCFHMAAIASVDVSVQEWSETHDINLKGTINIFEAISNIKDRKIPVMYASSAAIYGDNASVPLCENVQPSPLTPYGADKLGCEHHARIADLIHNIPSIGFRFFNVYGPRQDPASPYSGVISIFIDKITNDLPIKIFGSGTQTRDFVFVDDVVETLILGMSNHNNHSQVLNICTGRSTSIMQLAHTIASIDNKELQRDFHPARTGDIHISLGSPKKLLRSLNREPQIKLVEGIKRTIYALKHVNKEPAQYTLPKDDAKKLENETCDFV